MNDSLRTRSSRSGPAHRGCAPLSQLGAAMIEAAIMLPVLLILVGGLVDIGFAIWRTETLGDIAREAARAAASGSLRDDAMASAYPVTFNVGGRCLGRQVPTPNLNCASLAPYARPTYHFDCRNFGFAGSLECQAIAQAQVSMQSAGFDLRDWNLDALTCSTYEPPGKGIGGQVRLNITRRQGRGCFLCFFSDWIGSGSSTRPGWLDRASGIFSIDGQCR